MPARENHGSRWTKDEVAFVLSEWDGTMATVEVMAELLGRTVDAVRQRYYELDWGNMSIESAPVEKPLRNADSTVRVTVRREVITFEVDPSQVCSSCWTVRAASGSCLCE